VSKTPCGFCESKSRKITNEHIYAEWIGVVLGSKEPGMNVRHSMKRDEREGPTWLASVLDHKVRMACDRCNNGWMHDLEEHVRSVATPMILGQRIALDLKAHVAVATWAVKTAMVAEFAKKDSRYFTQAERRDLMDALSYHRKQWARTCGSLSTEVRREMVHALTARLDRSARIFRRLRLVNSRFKCL
jgi:hypothetical protein